MLSAFVIAADSSLMASVRVVGNIVINIIKPAYNSIYPSSIVRLTIDASETVKELAYSYNNRPYTVLCTNCQAYSGNKNFPTNESYLVVRAKDYSNSYYYQNTYFRVDSAAPYIYSTLPSAGTFNYMSTPFSIVYSEENLRNITLEYGKKYENKVTLSNCSSGYQTNCSAYLNLKSYEGKYIYYRFKVIDPFRYKYSPSVKIYVQVLNSTIHYTAPFSGWPTPGFFAINYSSENLQEISLEYGSNLENKYSLTGCFPGSFKTCYAIVNLAVYNQTYIYYRFALRDNSAVIFSNITQVFANSA